jgi:FHS family L-fucose permease-like MFS transporter
MPNLPARSTTAQYADAHGPAPLFPRGALVPFFLVTALFFLWGIPSSLNDVLIRQFMKSFALSRLQAGFVQSAFYMGYFLMALPAAWFMQRRGYKAGCLLGLALFSAGALLFLPAAIAGRYGFFLAALWILAAGLACLETASNSFIALCGAPESSERRLNFAQAFNPLGAITGVLTGVIFIFSGVELSPARIRYLQQSHGYAAYAHFETMRVVRPYLALGIFAVFWAVLLASVRFPVLADEQPHAPRRAAHGALRQRPFVLAVLAQFLYMGAQVGTWSYFIQYVQAYTHQPEKIAGYFLTGTLVAFGTGRFFSAWLMRFFAPARLMGVYASANVLLVGVGIVVPGWPGLWCIFLSSFFMSLMFPTIFAMGLRGLGEQAKTGGAILVMTVLGGAIFTPLMGWISMAAVSVAVSYIVPLLAYLYIAAFAFLWTAPEETRAGNGTQMPPSNHHPTIFQSEAPQ